MSAISPLSAANGHAVAPPPHSRPEEQALIANCKTLIQSGQHFWTFTNSLSENFLPTEPRSDINWLNPDVGSTVCYVVLVEKAIEDTQTLTVWEYHSEDGITKSAPRPYRDTVKNLREEHINWDEEFSDKISLQTGNRPRLRFSVIKCAPPPAYQAPNSCCTIL